MDDENGPTIVIDTGSGTTKAGFAGSNDSIPRAIFTSVVGRVVCQMYMLWPRGNHKDAYVGDEAICNRGRLRLRCPIERGSVTSWDDTEKLWHHTFYNALRVAPEEHPILLTEKILNPKADREKAVQIMFETFNVPSYYVANCGVLSLYATGRTTGIVLDSGYGITHTIPIYDGYSLQHAVSTMDLGGMHITECLQKLFIKNGYDNLNSTNIEARKIVNDIKEKLCYIPLDYKHESNTMETNQMQQKYELPDGSVINIGSEIFKATECLFEPDMLGIEQDGIHKLIYKSVGKCDVDMQTEMFDNIVLCGGNTMFNGLKERLVKELKGISLTNETLIDGYLRVYCSKNDNDKLLYKDIVNLMYKYTLLQFTMIAPKQRHLLPWIGGNILSSLSTFAEMVITKQEFDESGPGIVHRKCF